jgi:hypothetical protein
MQAKAVEIIDFAPEYRDAFRKFNEEWLKKFFAVEEDDDRLLQHPEEEIIGPGGAIFFARLEGKIVGTAALLKTTKRMRLPKWLSPRVPKASRRDAGWRRRQSSGPGKRALRRSFFSPTTGCGRRSPSTASWDSRRP